MTDDSFEEYKAPVVKTVVTKKRKHAVKDDKQEIETLRQKARLFAKTPEAWRSVSKYGLTRLREYVEEREHQQTQHLYETVFDFTHRMIGFVLDKGTKGDGYVQSEIDADITIRQCIETEMQNWVQYLSNRYKAVACIGIDVVNGKKRQCIEQPIVVIEETNETNISHQGRQTELAGETTAVFGAETVHEQGVDTEE